MIHFEKRHSKIQLLCLTGTNFRFFKDPLSMDYKNDCELTVIMWCDNRVIFQKKII